MRSFIVCTILVFCFSPIVFGQKFQDSFFIEEKFKKPVRVPTSALNSLKQDKEIQRCLKSGNLSKLSANWFEATKINLNNDRFPDLFVKAKEGCLTGNAISVWFLRNDKTKYEVVLTDYTLVVDIDKKLSKRFYNITTNRSTPSTTFWTVYIFNGKRYVKKRSYETAVKF